MARHRERTTSEPGKSGSITGKDWADTSSYPEGYTTSTEYWSTTGKSSTETCDDVVTPGFTRLVNSGHIINNDAHIMTHTITPPVATAFKKVLLTRTDTVPPRYSGHDWTGSAVVDELLLGPLLVPSDVVSLVSEIEQAKQLALTSAWARANESDVMSLVALAEGNKTISSCKSILRDAIKVGRAVRKLDYKYLRKQTSRSELSDKYMEARYAIRPLVYDMDGIVQALAKTNVYTDTRMTARGFQSVSAEYSDTIPYDSYNDVVRKVTVTANIRAGVLSNVAQSAYQSWGVSQPLESIWELVPFSFIFDWFANTGQSIAALSPHVGINPLASWVVIDSVTTTTNSLVIDTPAPFPGAYINTYSWSGSKSQDWKEKQRFANPVRSFLPTLRVNLDSLKLLDLAIIAKQFTR